MTLRVGIVGYGVAGRARARAVAARSDVELAAVWGGHRALESGCAVDSLVELLDRVDMVVVASPSEHHANQVQVALAAGRHVICEYPLAATSNQARALFALAQRQSRLLHVEHIEVLAPTTVWMAEVRERWTQASLLFELPGDGEVTAAAHAQLQLSRVHRAVHALGWPAAVHVDEASGSAIRARLIDPRGAVLSLELTRGSGPRRLVWRVEAPDGAREVIDRSAWCRGEPVALPEVALFAADLDIALARLWGERGAYVPEADEAELLDLVDVLGRKGPTVLSVKAP